MDFKTGQELLKVCEEQNMDIASVMKERERSMTQATTQEIDQKMERVLSIMKESVKAPLKHPVKSIGGLIGGEASLLLKLEENGRTICGDVMSKAIMFSMGVMEVNTSMGLIVAAPTAGSSGVVPGLVLALQECFDLADEVVKEGLYTASAIGYLAMRNATVSGAVGGCQAEVGVASAMAAAAAVQMMGGNPKQCLDAASTAVMNLLGLVCDPVAGLVECPCQSRNAMGVSNALACGQIALAGISQLIPLDEMLEAMYHVGTGLPSELRETALGGCAATKTGCSKGCGIG